jgi:two-component system response regulator EvgA
VAATILIVDDNERFRTRVRRMLEAAGYTVVGEAPDGESALAAVRRDPPDVVLLDLRLPDMSGLAVAEHLAREPRAPVVVITTTYDPDDFGDVDALSVRGIVPKSELSAEALAAVLG